MSHNFILLLFLTANPRLAVKGIPLVSYSSQVGVGYGLRVGLFSYEGGSDEYVWNLYGQFYQTTGGVQKHRLFFDRKGKVRVTITAEHDKALYENFYPAWLISEGDVTPGDTFYTYIHTTNFLRGVLRYKIAYLKLEYQSNNIKFRDGTVFCTSPYSSAFSGGKESLMGIELGVYLDHRDSENDPMKGYLIQASLGGWKGQSSFLTAFGAVHGYYSPFSWLTLVSRAAFSLVSAENVLFPSSNNQTGAPFYAYGWNYALEPFEGVGGRNSVRGYPTFFAMATSKFVLNGELRTRLLKFNFLGSDWYLGATAGIDLGAGISSDTEIPDEIESDNRPITLISSALGLRLAWGRDFIIAADFGFSKEFSTIDVTFGHAF